MKLLYLIFFLLFTSISIAQNDLLGEWFLHSITTNGVQHDNYIGDINLEFTNEVNSSQEFFSVGGVTPCEFYGGGYQVTSSSSIYFNGFAESASCGGDVDAAYTNKYIDVLSHNNTYSGDLTYEIVEDGNGFQLTLTNSFGDIALFKTYLPDPSKTLFKTWYSYSTETVDGVLYPSLNDAPTLTLFKVPNFFFYKIEVFGGCNELIGDHNIYESNEYEFSINIFQSTDNACDDNNYEITYFSVLDDVTNTMFNYELSEDGETLILTNAIGDILTFGSSPLQSTNLLGEWYLDYIEINNEVYVNNYNDESLFLHEFTELNGSDSQFEFSGYGVCNAIGGTLTPSSNQLTFNSVGYTLQDCDYTPSVIFENLYFSIFDNQNYPFDFSYVIDNGLFEQTLTIINPVTGDEATYGRNPNPEILNRTWYLSRIEIPGNPVIQIPATESPSLTLTKDINPITFKTIATGNGECNSFTSDYEVTLNSGDNIQLLDFSPTLGFCQSGYEDEYFSIIGYPSNNFSEFEITNNGSTLSVTDLQGATLIFGDQPLSISETNFNTLNISLKNNPVYETIDLILSPSESKLNYTIYSIDGKLINQNVLQSESINVDGINSGLYFIHFANSANQKQTIKFIKK